MDAKRTVETPEFEVQAVPMVTDQKRSVAEAARRLGIPENRPREWTELDRAKGYAACRRPV